MGVLSSTEEVIPEVMKGSGVVKGNRELSDGIIVPVSNTELVNKKVVNVSRIDSVVNEALSLGCGDAVIDKLTKVGVDRKIVAENVSVRNTEVLLGMDDVVKKSEVDGTTLRTSVVNIWENSLVSTVEEITVKEGESVTFEKNRELVTEDGTADWEIVLKESEG